MRILSFDTSAKSVSVALISDGKLIGEYYQNDGQTHSVTLLQMTEGLLKNCALTVNNIDAVAVTIGPGSFTGIRIGLSAAKGFAWAKELPCFGISTLEAMANGHREFEGIICAAMDARRNQIYNALFEIKDGILCRLCEDRAIEIQKLQEDLENLRKPVLVVGDGAELTYNSLNPCNLKLKLSPEECRMQRASEAGLIAYDRYKQGYRPSAATLIPNYLRKSQAEREKELKLASNQINI